MTLKEIKAAVNAGKRVHWKNELYTVERWKRRYAIVCRYNDNAIGLTWQDGKTMNGEERDFYIGST